MKVFNAKVGNLELITFRTTRADHPLTFAANGLISGLSSGHVALRLTFNDKDLYEKYICKHSNIPHQTFIDPKTKQTLYEVYISFWPFPIGLPWSDKSTLRNHQFDCEQSGNHSEMQYNEKFAEYFQPLAKITAPQVPIGKDILYSTVTLPPTIILHTSRLQTAFANQLNAEEAAKIVHAAEKFTKRYHEWRSAVINRQNAEYINDTDPRILAPYIKAEKIAQIRCRIAERTLMQQMYPSEQFTHDQFIKHLENFITFGFPERDIIVMPLVQKQLQTADHNSSKEIYGLDLEPILAYIGEIAAHPELHPYNVFGNNCARVALDIVAKGCKVDSQIIGDEVLELPWYVRWFGITVTPTMIMQVANKLQERFEALNAPIFGYENVANDDDYACTVEIEPLLKPKQQQLDHNPKQKVMQFYPHDSHEDELPTTRTGILCKLLEDATRMGS